MKKFTVSSYQLTETKKWAPSGTTFETIEDGTINIHEADIFPQKNRFDTKEEADNFFRVYFIQEGCTEQIIE